MRSLHEDEAGFSLVELLVVVIIMGAVAAGTTAAIVSSLRSQQFQDQLRTAQDDARVTVDNFRRELRGARRVEAATGNNVRFWADRNQDGLRQDDEIVTYAVELVPTTTDRYRVRRLTRAEQNAGQTGSIIAATLRNATPFTYVTPTATTATPSDPGATRAVQVALDFDVLTVQGPEAVRAESTVRLRNVA